MADGIAICYLFVFNAIWADVNALWQMEWPQFILFVMADVIAQWQMEWPLQSVSTSLLVDVVPRGQIDMGNYLSLSSEVLCRTSSHI